MRRRLTTLAVSACILTIVACSDSRPGPSAPLALATQSPSRSETPDFNLEVILRGDGFGLVKFRQAVDANEVIQLDTWVRDLEPNTAYLLQRAADTNLDANCTSTAWLTLGKGTTPQAITTDDRGTGREQLFRSVAAFPVGTQFDIHFRVINALTSAVVLTSECYQYTIR